MSRIDPTGLFWDGYESDESDYDGYLATPDDMAGAGKYDNSSSGSGDSSSSSDSGSKGGSSRDSGGFWEKLGNFFSGYGWKPDEEVAAEKFMDDHTRSLVNDFKNKYDEFDKWRNGSESSGDYGLRGSFGYNYLAGTFGRPFDINDYIYEFAPLVPYVNMAIEKAGQYGPIAMKYLNQFFHFINTPFGQRVISFTIESFLKDQSKLPQNPNILIKLG